MTRLDLVRSVAERYGLSVAEYLVLHIAMAFAMTPEEASAFVVKSIAKSAHADGRCHEAVTNCFERRLVKLSSSGMVKLTTEGAVLVQKITTELTTPLA
jgi:hypothetical protein